MGGDDQALTDFDNVSLPGANKTLIEINIHLIYKASCMEIPAAMEGIFHSVCSKQLYTITTEPYWKDQRCHSANIAFQLERLSDAVMLFEKIRAFSRLEITQTEETVKDKYSGKTLKMMELSCFPDLEDLITTPNTFFMNAFVRYLDA